MRGGIGSLGVNAGTVLLSLTTAFLLARLLGPEAYGIYAYVLAIIGLLALPAQFGLPALVVRETAKAVAQEHWSTLKGVWSWAFLVAGVMSIAIIALSGSIALVSSWQFSEIEVATYFWGLLLMPLMVFGRLCGACLRGLHYTVAGQLPDGIIRPGILAATLVILLGVYRLETPTASLAMAAHSGAAIVALACGLLILVNVKPREINRIPAKMKNREWLFSALPLGLVAGLQLINQQADILLLGFFKSAQDVGVYRVVVQGGLVAYFGMHTINVIVAPEIARIHEQNDPNSLQRLSTVGARAGFIVTLVPAIIFFLFGEQLLSAVVGPEYARGALALKILVAAHVVTAATGLVIPLLNMTGLERVVLRGIGIAVAINVIANIILIPRWGINGAALATGLSIVVWNGVLCRDVLRRLGIKTHILGQRKRKA